MKVYEDYSCQIYHPKYVDIEIGMTNDHYYYRSPMFEYDKSSDKETLWLLPDIVFGQVIKINLYGKV